MSFLNNIGVPDSFEAVKKQTFESPEAIIDFVNSLLCKPVKFFVGGGSICDTHYGQTNINDIDVFFESEADQQEFQKSLKNKYEFYVTKNALSFIEEDTHVQMIILYYGTPSEVLGTFDLNKSRIGMTSDKTLYIHETFDKHLYIDFDNFKSSTPGRYLKYADKGFALNFDEMHRAINHMAGSKLLNEYTHEPEDAFNMLAKIIPKYAEYLRGNDYQKLEPFLDVAIPIIKKFEVSKETEYGFWNSFFWWVDNPLLKYDEMCLAIVHKSHEKHPDKTKSRLGHRYQEILLKYPQEFI